MACPTCLYLLKSATADRSLKSATQTLKKFSYYFMRKFLLLKH